MKIAIADRRINAPSPVLHPPLDEFNIFISPVLFPLVDEISFVVSASDDDGFTMKFTLAVWP